MDLLVFPLSLPISAAFWGDGKEISSLLRKMESRKGRGVKVSRGNRKSFSCTCLEGEIRKLECSVNYNYSPLSVKGRGKSSGVSALSI